MASCQNCKALMVTLKSELHELHQQQKHLLSWNEHLMNQINRQKIQDQESMYWKQKYEEQTKINQTLENRIKMKNTQRISFSSHRASSPVCSLDQKEQPVLTARTTKKENYHSKSIKKMSELMKAIVLEKVDHHRPKSAKKVAGRRQDKRQIVLRIVDDRLNRIY